MKNQIQKSLALLLVAMFVSPAGARGDATLPTATAVLIAPMFNGFSSPVQEAQTLALVQNSMQSALAQFQIANESLAFALKDLQNPTSMNVTAAGINLNQAVTALGNAQTDIANVVQCDANGNCTNTTGLINLYNLGFDGASYPTFSYTSPAASIPYDSVIVPAVQSGAYKGLLQGLGRTDTITISPLALLSTGGVGIGGVKTSFQPSLGLGIHPIISTGHPVVISDSNSPVDCSVAVVPAMVTPQTVFTVQINGNQPSGAPLVIKASYTAPGPANNESTSANDVYTQLAAQINSAANLNPLQMSIANTVPLLGASVISDSSAPGCTALKIQSNLPWNSQAGGQSGDSASYTVQISAEVATLFDYVTTPPCTNAPAPTSYSQGQAGTNQYCVVEGTPGGTVVVMAGTPSVTMANEAVPIMKLNGNGTNKTLSFSFNPLLQFDMTGGAWISIGNINPGISLSAQLGLSASANNLSLNKIDPEQIVTASNTFNTNYISGPTLSIVSDSLTQHDISSTVQGLTVLGGFTAGALVGLLPFGAIGSIFGPILGIAVAPELGQLVSALVSNEIASTLSQQVAAEQKVMNTQVANILTQYSSTIQQVKGLGTYQDQLAQVQQQLYSNFGMTLSEDFTVYTASKPLSGNPPQELLASVSLQLPASTDTSASVSGTLVLPAYDCNYQATPFGCDPVAFAKNQCPPCDSRTTDCNAYGINFAPLTTGGANQVNQDLAGQSCRSLLLSNTVASVYQGSTAAPGLNTGTATSTVDGATYANTYSYYAGASSSDNWSPLRSGMQITNSTNMVEVNSAAKATALGLQYSGAPFYACSFTLSSLPKFSIIRLAMIKNSPLVARLHLDANGAIQSNQFLASSYSGTVASAGPATFGAGQANYFYRTTMTGPSSSMLTSAITNAVNLANQLPSAAGQALKQQVQQLANSFMTLDEFGNPQTNMVIGYRGIQNVAAQCTPYSGSTGELPDQSGYPSCSSDSVPSADCSGP